MTGEEATRLPAAGTEDTADAADASLLRSSPAGAEADPEQVTRRLLDWAGAEAPAPDFGPESSFWTNLEDGIERLRHDQPEWQAHPFLTPSLITERFPPTLQQAVASKELNLLTFARGHALVERDDFLPEDLRPEDLRSLAVSGWLETPPPQWLAAYGPFFGPVTDDAILAALPRLGELRAELLAETMPWDRPLQRLEALERGKGDPRTPRTRRR